MGSIIKVTDNMKNGIQYDGADRKFGADYDGKRYIVKCSGKNKMSVYSEYIASHFMRSIGVNSHNTMIGFYDDKLCVMIEDFTNFGKYDLKAYKDTSESSLETTLGSKVYTYDDVVYVIENHIHLDSVSAILDEFWTMFICDAILGDRDRHMGNWGFLIKDGVYEFAPVYDNANSLTPGIDKVSDKYVYTNMESLYKFFYDRVLVFPASQFQIKQQGTIKKTNYYEVIQQAVKYPAFIKQLDAVKSLYTVRDIFDTARVILSDDCLYLLDNTYKRYYIELITLRYMVLVLNMGLRESILIVERWFR